MTDIEKLHEWYLLRRRREFTESCNRDAAWNNIQNRIRSRKRARILRLWGSVAAISLLICGAAVLFREPWAYGSSSDFATGPDFCLRDKSSSPSDISSPLAQRMSKHEAHVSSLNSRLSAISVPPGSEFSKDLADGTRVVLNAGATLSYPVSFDTAKREVHLLGEAYFEVAHSNSNPFLVNTPSGFIEVLGTQFNVDAEAEQTTVTLQEGSVRLHFEGRDFLMKPGEQACMTKDGRIEIRQVNATNYTSWSTGTYEFCDIPLSEITHQLSLWYDVTIDIADDRLAASRYTGVIMRSEPLQSALNMLCVISDIKVKYSKSKIEICKK